MKRHLPGRHVTVVLQWTCMASGMLLLVAGSAHAAGAATALERAVLPRIESHRGKVAVVIKHLETGESFGYRESAPMPTASLIKFPVMIEAYRQAEQQQLDLNELTTLRDEDKVPGSGLLTQHFSAGARISLRDAIRLMIVFSDNTATNLVLDRIGIGSVAAEMEKLGCPNTKIHAKVFRRDTSLFPERSTEFGLGSTTAAETLRLYEMLYRRQLVSEAASAAMNEHLLHCDDSSKLTRLLPVGVKVAHKSGAVAAARCDAGIIYSPAGPIAVCVLTSENEDQRWNDENAGARLCAEIARAAFDHFNPAGANRTDGGERLAVGSTGMLVESLQRTLNARLSPSPKLAVDGDFGPQTRAAVVRFQQQQSLAASGEVGPETWRALGPLVTRDPPVPNPQVVNSQRLPRLPADPLTGPPLVTCKAWAVADATTGTLLWGANERQPLDFASTTKIMTAYLVLKLADTEPTVLDEPVVFSERADQTSGSTSGIRAGESLPVRELLYGLLLPSGNDAAHALAEHFGERVNPATPAELASADDRAELFVGGMNHTARQLGMLQTHYVNPHGLTAKNHVSTAADLLVLARAAFAVPRFRDYVSTRQHGCALAGPGGYTRNVLWVNTNQLLRIEGYLGVKTGTTEAAGACLVSASRRGGDELLMVVLGASSSPARYTDSRNLYRWCWQQRSQ